MAETKMAQMTDVFIRTTSNKDLIRQGFFLACQARWAKEPVRLAVYKDMGIREFRVLCEEKAQSDPYIVTDDDVLILGTQWVERGVAAMLGDSSYGVCSTLSMVEGENYAVGHGVIYPMHAVGQPMWIRRGLMADLPPLELQSECQTIQAHIEAKGFREGLINGLRHNHLGHGFSSNPALHWGF